jgi:hypothetical protein
MEKILIGLITGFIIGGCFTAVAIAFLMGARPDTPKKRMEDAEGLKEYMHSKRKYIRKFTIGIHKIKYFHSEWYYYLIPKRLTLKCNRPIYKWLIWVFSFKQESPRWEEE